MHFPMMTEIMACQTLRPVATRAPPSCQFEIATWLVVQKEVNVQTVHVRRFGGNGRMSSLIQTFETECSSLGRRAHRLTAARLMVGKVP